MLTLGKWRVRADTIRIVQRRYENRFGGPNIYWPILLPSLLTLPIRILWQFWANTSMSGVFWILAFADEPFRWRRRTFLGKAFSLPMYIGAAMNALVTLSNGGKMPVVGRDEPFSFWVPAVESHRFLMLADRYGGFSLGDFFLFGGFALLLILAVATPLAEMAAGLAPTLTARFRR